jgi:hypothetical protein
VASVNRTHTAGSQLFLDDPDVDGVAGVHPPSAR